MDTVMMEDMDTVMVDTDIVTEVPMNKFSKVSTYTFWQTHWEVSALLYLHY